MGIVTKVEVQKRHKERVNVYIDDEFCCGLNAEIATKNGVKKGADFTHNDLIAIMVESDKMTALQKACDYIAKMPKTEKNIRDYLAKKGYEELVINSVIDKMKEYNYIDDVAYAKEYLQSVKDMGVNKIRYNLLKRGIKKNVVDTILCDYDDSRDVMLDIAKKFMKDKEYSMENFAKLSRRLASKGFEYDKISSIIRVLREDNADRY